MPGEDEGYGYTRDEGGYDLYAVAEGVAREFGDGFGVFPAVVVRDGV